MTGHVLNGASDQSIAARNGEGFHAGNQYTESGIDCAECCGIRIVSEGNASDEIECIAVQLLQPIFGRARKMVEAVGSKPDAVIAIPIGLISESQRNVEGLAGLDFNGDVVGYDAAAALFHCGQIMMGRTAAVIRVAVFAEVEFYKSKAVGEKCIFHGVSSDIIAEFYVITYRIIYFLQDVNRL